jgi:anti-anti-sigma regulatory factor
MATNFHILSNENKDGLHLKLKGDFDGTSACELLETLKKHDSCFNQIFIDTNNLKTIDPFGREVFQKKIGTFKQPSSHLVFVGENGRKISPN